MMLVTAISKPFAPETDGAVKRDIEAVSGAACTGKIGDGESGATPIATLVRVDTGARGADAL